MPDARHLFETYRGIKPRDGVVDVAVVQRHTVKKLAEFIGGEPAMKTIRGGSRQYCGIVLRGDLAEIGDYIIADRGNVFQIWKKEPFDQIYTRKNVV